MAQASAILGLCEFHGACLWHKPEPYWVSCILFSRTKCKDECGYDAIWETLGKSVLFPTTHSGLVSHYLSLFSATVSTASSEGSRACPARHYSRAARNTWTVSRQPLSFLCNTCLFSACQRERGTQCWIWRWLLKI